MRLLLIRHGEATWQAASDSQRPLTKYGQQQVIQQANNKAIDWQGFEQLLVSPYLRTQQTSALLQEYLGHLGAITLNNKITPDGQCEMVQELLLSLPQADTILVTHQPLISSLIGYFGHGDMLAGEPMMPASVAVLSGSVFARQCMQLETLAHV